MTPASFRRVMTTRRTHELWTEAAFLEDREDNPSRRKAFRLLREAVRLGNTECRNNLAHAYDIGMGIKPSRRMAVHWYRKASRSGSYLGATNLGITLKLEGRISSAIPSFYKAISMGDPDARLHLAKMFVDNPNRREEACRLLREYIAAGPQRIAVLIPGKSPEDAEDEGYEEARELLAQLESQNV